MKSVRREKVTSLRLAPKLGTNVFNAFLHLRKVRSRPVNLRARWAPTELVVIYFGKRLEVLNDFGLRCVLQRSVTAKTARKWRDQLHEIKTAEDLDCLLVRVLGPRIISVLNDRVHE